jgi:hypothetical protein
MIAVRVAVHVSVRGKIAAQHMQPQLQSALFKFPREPLERVDEYLTRAIRDLHTSSTKIFRLGVPEHVERVGYELRI